MEAARKALLTLPFDLPTEDSQEDTWSLVNASLPVGQNSPQKAKENATVLPIRFEQGKRITLIHDPFRRVTLTDSGMEDPQGRHLFYQEEWEQRQGTTTVKRWAVAVNTGTGQHTLLRRYPIREFHGEMDDSYQAYGRDFLSRVKLPESSEPPSMPEITSALADTVRARQELNGAIQHFKTRIRDAMARNDELLAAQDKLPLDDELPLNVRATLFAIRGHIAGTADILDAEYKVQRAMEQAAGRVRILEAMIAWVNGSALEREGSEDDSHALLEALNRSDTEISLTRTLEREAEGTLPPMTSRSEAQFPAMMKDAVVRIRGLGLSADPGGTLKCRQEIWRFTGSVKAQRQVKRTIVFIDLGPKTGIQIPQREK